MRQRYELPPIDESSKGNIDLFSWIATLNFPDMRNELEHIDEPRDVKQVPIAHLDYVTNLSHEVIHFIQALSASFVYRHACLLWYEIQNVTSQVRKFPKDSPIALPLQVESKIPNLLAALRAKSSNLSMPEIDGLSALDIIEGAAVYVQRRMNFPKLDNAHYVQQLNTEYKEPHLQIYSNAYLLAEWYLGEDVFDIFSVICFLALCTDDPSKTFCEYIKCLGRSGILLQHRNLPAQEIIELGAGFGITNLKTAPQEIKAIGKHPVLFPAIKNLMDKLPKGFKFVEFACRPYECEDVNIFRLMIPLRFCTIRLKRCAMDNALRLVQIQDEDLERGDISNLKRVFTEIAIVPKHAKLLRGKVGITFPKYDEDPRENFEIDEVRTYVQGVDREFPYFLYFLDLSPQLNQTFFWFACLASPLSTAIQGNKVAIGIDPVEFSILVATRIIAVDQYCKEILDNGSMIVKTIIQQIPRETVPLVTELLRESQNESN